MPFQFPTLAEDDYLREINRGADLDLQQRREANAASTDSIRRQGDLWANTLTGSFDAYQKGEDRSRKQLAEDQRLEREAAAEERALAEEQRRAGRYGQEGEEFEHKKGQWGAEDEALGMEMEAKRRAQAAAKRKEDYDLAPTKDGKTRETETWEVGDEAAKLGNKKTKAEIDKLNAEAAKASKGDPEGMIKAAAPELSAVALLPASPERDAKVSAIAAKYKLDPAQAHAIVATEAAKTDKTPENTQKLRGEYNALGTTKNTETIIENYNRIHGIEQQPDPSGASDMALIYSFMKLNDPGSTVREGEYATAENTGGVSDKLRSMYNKAISGEKLSPEVRKQFFEQAKGLAASQIDTQKAIDERYRSIATTGGVNPDLVINPNYAKLGSELRPPPKANAAAPGMASPPQDGDAQAATPMTLEQKKARIEELKKRKAARGGQ